MDMPISKSKTSSARKKQNVAVKYGRHGLEESESHLLLTSKVINIPYS